MRAQKIQKWPLWTGSHAQLHPKLDNKDYWFPTIEPLRDHQGFRECWGIDGSPVAKVLMDHEHFLGLDQWLNQLPRRLRVHQAGLEAFCLLSWFSDWKTVMADHCCHTLPRSTPYIKKTIVKSAKELEKMTHNDFCMNKHLLMEVFTPIYMNMVCLLSWVKYWENNISRDSNLFFVTYTLLQCVCLSQLCSHSIWPLCLSQQQVRCKSRCIWLPFSALTTPCVMPPRLVVQHGA